MEAISLSELTNLIKETIDSTFSEYYMVVAEINQINVNYSGHAYLQLIEKDEKDKTLANLRAVIWANKYNLISEYFESVTGSELQEEMKILVKTEVRFHAVYGLSLVIHDIDPTYTLGDIEKQRQKIINQLKEDGIFEMNKELEIPIVPQRIAIISSPTAAGLDDFLNHLDSNEYGYSFEHKLFKATMQGEKTEDSVISAFDKIFNEQEKYDVVVIIRGGGSKLDLSAFDSYNIAANIAQFPLPILSGIGHQRDLSIADMVANKSLKTPTATADFIIQEIVDFETELNSAYEEITDFVTESINEEEFNLSFLKSNLNNLVKSQLYSHDADLRIIFEQLKAKTVIFISKKEEYLRHSVEKHKNSVLNELKNIETENSQLKQKLVDKTENYFVAKSNELTLISSKLNAHDPQHILDLGFSVT
ncbi:MAG: exodeoxyribonuclease VII large subunit, partial [Bacteroidota bacterium]|nr:exodeoxyribonuclease VII large subunit [Bacteroidota bacterium]